jgi:HEAT repeat protein
VTLLIKSAGKGFNVMSPEYVLVLDRSWETESQDRSPESGAQPLEARKSLDARIAAFIAQESIVPLTRQLCSANNPRERLHAAWALQRMGTPGIEPLLQALRTGGEQTQVMAAIALVQMGDSILKPLIAAFSTAAKQPRQKMIWILYTVGGERAANALIKALVNDPDAKVRRYAAWALGYLKIKAAIPYLIAALNDTQFKVRFDSAVALVKIGQMPDSRVQTSEALIHALFAGSVRTRKTAAMALAWLRDMLAVNALTVALGDASPDVRVEAAFALGWIHHPRAVDPLILALSDPDPQVRTQAAAALGWIGDKRAVEPLIWLIEDEDDWVPYAAVEALGDIGDVRAIAPLVLAYEGANNHVRRTARDALCKLGYEWVT